MRTTKQHIGIGIALFVVFWTTQPALAWYNPTTGRWLTRDGPTSDHAFIRAASWRDNDGN